PDRGHARGAASSGGTLPVVPTPRPVEPGRRVPTPTRPTRPRKDGGGLVGRYLRRDPRRQDIGETTRRARARRAWALPRAGPPSPSRNSQYPRKGRRRAFLRIARRIGIGSRYRSTLPRVARGMSPHRVVQPSAPTPAGDDRLLGRSRPGGRPR